jgi:hypothetical protein
LKAVGEVDQNSTARMAKIYAFLAGLPFIW